MLFRAGVGTFLHRELEGEDKSNIMASSKVGELGMWQGQFSRWKLIYTEEDYSECDPQCHSSGARLQGTIISMTHQQG